MRSLIPLFLLLSACASSPEYVEIAPDCTVPPRPTLPQIPGEALESLPDEVYWALETREKRLVDWGLELEAIALELCRDSDTEGAQTP